MKTIVILTLLLATLSAFAVEWIPLAVKGYEVFPGGMLVLYVEPVQTLEKETRCIARGLVAYQKWEFAVYDSTARYDPNGPEVRLEGIKLREQFADSTGVEESLSTIYQATKQWSILPYH